MSPVKLNGKNIVMNIVLEHQGMNGGGVIRYAVVETAWGYAGIIGQGDLLLRVMLPEADERSVVCKMKSDHRDLVRDDDLLPNVQQVLRD